MGLLGVWGTMFDDDNKYEISEKQKSKFNKFIKELKSANVDSGLVDDSFYKRYLEKVEKIKNHRELIVNNRQGMEV